MRSFPIITVGLALAFSLHATAQFTLQKDIRPGRLGSVRSGMVSTGDIAYFVADDGKLGATLWRTNGSPAGTFHLRTGLKNVKDLTAVGNKLLFRADDGKSGDELWVSDGSSAGTRLVVDLRPGSWSSMRAIVASDANRVYFFAQGMSNNKLQLGLWASDGTQKGTVLLKAGGLGFTSYTYRLWRSVSYKGQLYFWINVTGSVDLWRSNGTAAGTQKVHSLGRSTSIKPMVAWNGLLWCDVVRNAKHEIWTSDGTSAGTKKFMAGLTTSLAGDAMVPAGKTMFFGLAPSGTGALSQLWKTDGTVAGTKAISTSMGILGGVAVGEGRAFVVGFGSGGVRPWVTDGSAKGTIQLSTTGMMAQSVSFGYSFERVGTGSVVAFHGSSANGQELWVTDCTPQGTKEIDYNKGWRVGMGAWAFARAKENYVFALDDGKIGSEPYAVRLTWFGAAFDEPYGTGCKGAAGIPVLRGIGGAPKLGTSNFALDLTKARPKAVAVFALSAAPATLPIGRCTLLVSLAGSVLEGRLTDANGAARIPLAVPNNPSLVGINFYTQAIVIDPNGSLLGQFALSNGLRVLVGR